MQNLLDSELVRLAQGGNDEAFSELFRRHYVQSVRQAVRIVRERECAEDEVQNAYLSAWRNIGKFHGEAKFSTWLMRIVVNQCLMRLRQQRRARLISLDTRENPGTGRPPELASAEAGPEAGFAAGEIREVLAREIRRIPPLLRSAVWLRDVNELPIDDVADRLGITVTAAKSRLLRARAELRRRMEKHLGRLGLATLTG